MRFPVGSVHNEKNASHEGVENEPAAGGREVAVGRQEPNARRRPIRFRRNLGRRRPSHVIQVARCHTQPSGVGPGTAGPVPARRRL